MRLAWTAGSVTPAQLRAMADLMDTCGIERVDVVPQISETRGQWFRVDGEALARGRVVFEPETTEEAP